MKMPDAAEVLGWYERYRLPLYRYAYRMTGGARQAAEDLVHDCFVEALRGKVPFSGNGELRAYLFGVVRNLGRHRHPQAFTAADELAELPQPGPDQLRAVETAERGEAVTRALAALPPLQREALVLFEYEELTIEEIARIAGVQAGAVKARLHRARENLRKQLAPLMAPERKP